MNTQSYATYPAGSLPARKTEPTGKQRQYENRIETRANILASRVTVLAQSHFPSLRSDQDAIEEDLEALLAKEARVRWLVRVAKYSEGANREALWREAEKRLVALEKAAEEILHAECA
jgi:hypothetical protein